MAGSIRAMVRRGLKRYGARFRTALHESGHAALTLELAGKGHAFRLLSVTLFEDAPTARDPLGRTHARHTKGHRHMATFFAGGAAAERVFLSVGETRHQAWANDIDNLREASKVALREGLPVPGWDDSLALAERMLRRPRVARATVALANVLAAVGRLDGNTAKRLYYLWRK